MTVTIDPTKYIPTQREDLRNQINEILNANMEDLFNEYVVDEIRIIAAAANMPRHFIDGVKFVKTGKNEGEIINTWGTKAEPLAKWFNYGTTTHWIEPLDPDGVLAFPATGGRNASAIFFQGGQPTGDTMFSKGHYVAGVPRTEVMEIGYKIGSQRLAEEAGKIVDKELEVG
jgi:hypothetical protein